MLPRILFVGRQPDQFAPLWRQLSLGEYVVVFAASQARALRELSKEQADVIVLDSSTLRSPAKQLSRSLRMSAPEARIILITAANITGGLSYDYHLSQPLGWRKLHAAIEEAARSERRRVLAQGEFVLDIDQQTLIGPAGENRLTPKLFGLMRLLMQNPDKPVLRAQIMREVWKTDFLDDTRTLDVHISWLRRCIEPAPKTPVYLRTRRGVGYVFHPNGNMTDGVG